MKTDSDTPQEAAGAGSSPSSCSAWCISSDGENYGHVTFPTKEDAIEEGEELYDGEPFHVGKLERPIQPEDFFDADDWLEHVSCQDDYAGEHCEDWDDSTPEQRVELTIEVRKVMAAWLDRHNLRPKFWNVPNPEYVEPNAKLSDAKLFE